MKRGVMKSHIKTPLFAIYHHKATTNKRNLEIGCQPDKIRNVTICLDCIKFRKKIVWKKCVGGFLR